VEKYAMQKFHLVILLLLLVPSAHADQLDGLEGLATIFILIVVGAIFVLLLVISSIYRFTTRPHKVNKTLNFSGSTLIVASFLEIRIIGFNSIDPGFLSTCIGVGVLSGILIYFNYKLVDKEDPSDELEA
jgi:NADH:ubiquinone oxidoreductase subunit 6 (subunit J)